MAEQAAIFSLAIKQQRDMGGERNAIDVGHQQGEALFAHEGGQGRGVVNVEKTGLVHGGYLLGVSGA